jgi:hypothetical protein
MQQQDDDRAQTDGRPAVDPIENLRRMDLRQVALLAFVVGVLFHACVVFAVLDDGSGGASQQVSPRTEPATQQRTPTPTVPPDRTSCAEIRGTEYRSAAERSWFIQNCSAG